MGFWDCSERRAKGRAASSVAAAGSSVRVTPIGPAGEEASHAFPADTEQIRIGREAAWAEVLVPMQETRVARRHLELRRQASGEWVAVRQGDRYAAVGGRAFAASAPLRPGDVLTLGQADGPRFRFDLVAPAAAHAATDSLRTRTQELVRDWQDVLCDHMRLAVAGFAVLLLALGGLGYGQYWQWQDRGRLVAALAADIEAREAGSQQATAAFGPETLETFRRAAHIVVIVDGTREEGIATAWPVSPTEMVTNAHVVTALAALREGVTVLVRSPGVAPVSHRVADWEMHPAYEAFRSYVAGGLGTETLRGEFSVSTRPGAYDIAILKLEADAEAGPVLELASPERLASLGEGEEVAFAGYPLRGIDGADIAHINPAPKIQFGRISALTNFFMFPSDQDPSRAQLVHNSIPVTGGASGGPVIDSRGQVVAVVSSGTVIDIPAGFGAEGASTQETRAPSAALVNYAQRADLVWHMRGGTGFDAPAETVYWDGEAAKFGDRRSFVVRQLLDDAARASQGRAFTAAEPLRRRVAPGLFAERFPIELEAGRTYAVLAYSDGPQPIQLQLRGAGEELGPETSRAARLIFTPARSGTGEMVVFMSAQAETGFDLTVFTSR